VTVFQATCFPHENSLLELFLFLSYPHSKVCFTKAQGMNQATNFLKDRTDKARKLFNKSEKTGLLCVYVCMRVTSSSHPAFPHWQKLKKWQVYTLVHSGKPTENFFASNIKTNRV
jgi:hypothetical protein